MGAKKRRRLHRRVLRPSMQSPGRLPVWRRGHKQLFWEAIRRGLASEEAAAAASVSPAVGTRWFREGGGMPTVSTMPLSDRYLSFEEREEIAIFNAQKISVREMARRLNRSPATIMLPPAAVPSPTGLLRHSGMLTVGPEGQRPPN